MDISTGRLIAGFEKRDFMTLSGCQGNFKWCLASELTCNCHTGIIWIRTNKNQTVSRFEAYSRNYQILTCFNKEVILPGFVA